LWLYLWLYVGALWAPIFLLALFSFHDSPLLALPWRGFSLRWYEAMVQSPELLRAFRMSLIVAIFSSTGSVILGALLGLAATRFRFPGRRVLVLVAVAPMIIPYLGLAVALLMTFVAVGFQPSVSAVTLGHVVIAIPYVMLLVAARAAGMGSALEEAAMDLGANWWEITRRVYLPVMRPAMLAGFVSAFVLSLDEFYLAFFLSGSDQTLPVYFFSGLRRPELLPPTLALVTLLTLVTIILLTVTQGLASRFRQP
jgi:spermidine/putrescine transport system permease protein